MTISNAEFLEVKKLIDKYLSRYDETIIEYNITKDGMIRHRNTEIYSCEALVKLNVPVAFNEKITIPITQNIKDEIKNITNDLIDDEIMAEWRSFEISGVEAEVKTPALNGRVMINKEQNVGRFSLSSETLNTNQWSHPREILWVVPDIKIIGLTHNIDENVNGINIPDVLEELSDQFYNVIEAGNFESSAIIEHPYLISSPISSI